MKKILSIFKYGFGENKALPLIVVLVPAVILSFFNYSIQLNGKSTFWDRVVDPALTISGFILPAVIWLYYIFNRDWKEKLSKRLNVHFILKENYVLSCFESILSSEGDIRNWGQQIGSQMNEGGNLSFLPYIKTTPPIEKYDDERNEYYLLYEITMFLKFDNDGNYIPAANTKTQFKTDKYTIWVNNNYYTTGNIKYTIDKQTMPADYEEIRKNINSNQIPENNPDIEQ